MRRFWLSCSVLGAGLLSGTAAWGADESPKPEAILSSYVPKQKDVEIETPKPAEFAKCTIKAERLRKGSAWTVFGPSGQVLRRFVDTNKDDYVDQWRYYNNGIEVYREIDSNFNEKPDQYRWLNTGGSRWGLDPNEDRKIDEWKLLSAEEATRVAINALIAGDADALRLVLVSKDDLETLKLEPDVAEKILSNVSNPSQKLREVLGKTRSLTANARWMRFDVASAMPSVIPSDDGKAGTDLILYENAMAILETEGTPPKNSLLVQIGELVKVGDVWKLTQIPLPIEGNQVQLTAGVLMQPSVAESSDGTTTASSSPSTDPRVTALVKQLQELDAKAPTAASAPADFVAFNSQRSRLLRQLVSTTKGAEQENWFKQMIDGLTSSVQTGTYNDGLQELKTLELQVKQQRANSPLAAYVAYRRMLAEYSVSVQEAKTSAAQAKVQENWIKDLQNYVETFPKADDAPDAMLQLATGLEFAGKAAEARKWFKELADNHAKTTAGKKAAGAMARLGATGKSLALDFAGLEGGRVNLSNYRGKVTLVVYWATWCKPCFEDLPKLRAMYQQYRAQGFEVIGVNLDTQATNVKAYLQQNNMTWPQIHEPGGLESPPGLAYGVISLPTMFLVDREGIVHSRPASMEDVKAALPELLGLKKPMAASTNANSTN